MQWPLFRNHFLQISLTDIYCSLEGVLNNSTIERDRLGIAHHVKGIHERRKIGALGRRLTVDRLHCDVAAGPESAVEQVVQKSQSTA